MANPTWTYSRKGREYHPPYVSKWHRYSAKGLGAFMWFWMMYRAKEDLPYLRTRHLPWHERNHRHH